MMDLVQANLSTLVWCIIAALVAIGAFAYRSTLEFWLNHWKYTFPVLGKTARLSRHGIHGQGGWTDSERTLCGDYNKFISYLSRDEFNKRNAYLAKADDSGRSPTPVWLLALLTVLVIAEGLGFSYLLGSWMARDGSANTHTLLMVAIVLVLCVIMVFLTHVAGHQLYRSNLVVRSRKQWKQDKTQERFSSRKVKLDDDQSVDDREPDYTQVVNRVGTSHSYFMVGVTIAVILIIAVTSTWMRWSNLNAEQTREAMGMSQSADAGNPFATANAVPAELVSSQKAADDRARAEESSSTRSEGAAAFITLAVIFVVTQIVGIFGGFAWGFGGRESRAAWKTTKGFTTFEDYNNYYAPLRAITQSQLENLQKRMAENADISGKTFEKTFRDYVMELRAQSDLDAAPVRSAAGTPPAERAAESVAPPPVTPPPAVDISTSVTIDELVSEVEGTTDLAHKKELIYRLAEPVRTQVIGEIKLRKERATQAKHALESELDDLFKV
jgi:flagellar basal body-associated protein FliL